VDHLQLDQLIVSNINKKGAKSMFAIEPTSWLELLDLSVNSKRNMEEYYDNLYHSAFRDLSAKVKIDDFGDEDKIRSQIETSAQ
jgi:hypothetical protein